MEERELTELERAEKAVSDMAQQNKDFKDLLDRRDKQQVEQVLSGKSTAGAVKEPEQEETPQEYAKKVMSGVQ